MTEKETEQNIDKDFLDSDPELELLSRTNPDLAARKIISSKKLRKIFGIDLKPYIRESNKVGRNEPCTCGSGLKYKKCCGK